MIQINPNHISKICFSDKTETREIVYYEQEKEFSYHIKTSKIIKKFWFFKTKVVEYIDKKVVIPKGFYQRYHIYDFQSYLDSRIPWDDISNDYIPTTYNANEITRIFGYLVVDNKVYNKPYLKIIMQNTNNITEVYDTYEEVLKRLEDFKQFNFIKSEGEVE